MPVTVGFDLDMTLIDSRPGIRAAFDELSSQTGVVIDSAIATTRLGGPLDDELTHWFAPDDLVAAGHRFRALYPEHAIAPTRLLPGAAEAVAAVRAHGGAVVVVTGKYGPNATLHVDHLGLVVDGVHGGLLGAGKASALLQHGADVYVGDHTADIDGAHAAGAVAVAVATGPHSAEALRRYGADVVLNDLTEFPAWLDEHVRLGKVTALEQRLAGLGSVLVAFSGGADSAFLLAAAVRALGPAQVVAATAVSDSLPAAELTAAAQFAASLGVVHQMPRTAEMSRPEYRANAGDRCYFCKAELIETLLALATERGLDQVLTGTNADDVVAGFRPGIRAAAERGALTPLADAGLTKTEIRRTSREWALSTWDKPAAACLASRIAYGVEVNPARLAAVGRAEIALRGALLTAGHPVRDLRVRDLGHGRARIEVDPAAVDAMRAAPELLALLPDFAEVSVEVFRSGSLNDALGPQPIP